MKITHTHSPVSTTSWYLALENAPEVDFRGQMLSPTEVIATTVVMDGEGKHFLAFSSPLSGVVSQFTSHPTKGRSMFSELSAEFLAAIMKECR